MKEKMSDKPGSRMGGSKALDPGVREKHGGAIHMAKISLGFRKFQNFAQE